MSKVEWGVSVQVGRPEVYVTTNPQWDIPDATLCVRVRVRMNIEGPRSHHREFLDARAAWTAQRVGAIRRIVLTQLVRWFRHRPAIVATIIKFSSIVWTFEADAHPVGFADLKAKA